MSDDFTTNAFDGCEIEGCGICTQEVATCISSLDLAAPSNTVNPTSACTSSGNNWFHILVTICQDVEEM